MLSRNLLGQQGLASTPKVTSTLELESAIARVWADAQLLAALRKRDGILPRRPNVHRDADTCPYSEHYAHGACPWCRQAGSAPAKRPHHRRKPQAA